MEKKNEYIDKLLKSIQSLELKVSAVKQAETLPFSFFRDAFQKGQEVMSLLHEMEMLQIEGMKRQMGKLVSFLSESETQNTFEGSKPVEHGERSIKPVIDEAEEVANDEKQNFSEETEKISEEENIIRKNTYAEGVALPAYANPRNVETKKEVAAGEIPVICHEETVEEKHVIRSVNDIIQVPPAKLDVKRSLSLNDRFYYQRELFDNDREAMNSVMLKLHAFDNYEETERYLREKTSWNFDDEKVKSFLELLKKEFE